MFEHNIPFLCIPDTKVRISPLESERGHSDVAVRTLNQYMIVFGKHTDTAGKLMWGQAIATQYLLVGN